MLFGFFWPYIENSIKKLDGINNGHTIGGSGNNNIRKIKSAISLAFLDNHQTERMKEIINVQNYHKYKR